MRHCGLLTNYVLWSIVKKCYAQQSHAERCPFVTLQMHCLYQCPVTSNRHHRSNSDCQKANRENYQVCSVQYCVQQLHTAQCTHIWTDPKPRLHDKTCCQTGFTAGWMFVYTIQLVVKPVGQQVVSCIQTSNRLFVYTMQPVVKPDWQPVVSCKRALTVFWIGLVSQGNSLCLDSFFCVHIFCVSLYIVCCSIVTWWVGPGGVEAWSLGLLFPSVLWHCWLGHLTHKTRPRLWAIMCVVGRQTLLSQSIFISVFGKVPVYTSSNGISVKKVPAYGTVIKALVFIDFILKASSMMLI